MTYFIHNSSVLDNFILMVGSLDLQGKLLIIIIIIIKTGRLRSHWILGSWIVNGQADLRHHPGWSSRYNMLPFVQQRLVHTTGQQQRLETNGNPPGDAKTAVDPFCRQALTAQKTCKHNCGSVFKGPKKLVLLSSDRSVKQSNTRRHISRSTTRHALAVCNPRALIFASMHLLHRPPNYPINHRAFQQGLRKNVVYAEITTGWVFEGPRKNGSGF